jgi:FkbM family methyltransferase
MAQVARQIKQSILSLMPNSMRANWLNTHPNWRKAAPPQPEFVFDNYLGNLRVNIDTRYKVERIMWTGSYETALQRWMKANVKPGWTCIDVGANVGAIMLGMGQCVGPSGRVIAIEPGQTNLKRLRANLALNPSIAPQVTVIEAGVSDKEGTLNWVEETENPGNAMLELSPLYKKQSGDHRHSVRVDLLDHVLAQCGATQPQFIKIDVEGMEINVLKGAMQTLVQRKPILYFETLARYSKGDDGGNLDAIAQLLRDLDYAFYRVDGEGNAAEFSPPHWPDYTLAVATKS